MPILREPTLEDETAAKLQNALISSAIAANNLPEGSGVRGCPEMREISIRLAITGGVQEVEGFNADLKAHAVWQPENFEKGEIFIRVTGAIEQIASEVAGDKGCTGSGGCCLTGGDRKCIAVEPHLNGSMTHIGIAREVWAQSRVVGII